MLIDFGKRQKGKLEPAAIVEIELVRLIDHRLIVTRSARLVPGRGRSTNQPLFVRQYDVVEGAFFRRDRCDTGRDARSEIANGAGEQFKTGAPRDDFAWRKRQCGNLLTTVF